MAKKFTTPQNAFNAVIQSAATEQQTHEEPAPKQEYYRFNMRFPIECKEYLQEVAWQNRTTTTAYLVDLVRKDMAEHPNWRDSLDALNK